MVTVKINGKEITVEDNTLILDAARAAGFEIPTFCYQADLAGIGSCRMCLVEIEGQKKLQPSCVTPVLHGMSILTETQTVQSARASMLEFLLANHAMDCPVCDKGGECELQDAVHKYGPRQGRHAEPKFKFHEKDYILSPVVVKNSNRCVNCMKCVRVCREVVGANVLGALGRGDHQEPTSFQRTLLDCDHCGNCIEVCPVGCFMRLPYRYKARPWDLKGTDTICPYCATGCRMVVEERQGTAVRSRAQYGVGINSETLCARGRFGFDYMNDIDRLKSPIIKRYGKLETVSWDEAFDFIREHLGKFNGTQIGGIASARLTNEELYLFQKLMRETLHTNNIDSSVRWDSNAVEAYIEATGMSEGGVSLFDVAESETLLVIGSQLSDENPVVDYIIRRISSYRRMNIIIVSPRAMKLDSSASITIRHQPGEEVAILAALLKGIKGEAVQAVAGADATGLNNAAQKLKGAEKIGIIAGTEFLRFPEGNSNLATLRTALKSAGKKVLTLPVLDRCNQRGAWEMGVHPTLAPGYKKADFPGLNTEGMLEAASKQQIEAMYLAGIDLLTIYPDVKFAKEALSKLKFLIVQDMFMTETAKMADVILPSVTPAEKNGTFTNQEGRVQAMRALSFASGHARSDFDIIAGFGRAVDREFCPKTPSAAFEEIRRKVGMYSDVNLMFVNRKNNDNRLDDKTALVKQSGISFKASGAIKKQAQAAGEGFTLVTGNHMFHSGKLSRRSETLLALMKDAIVEISEKDAETLGLSSGEKVKVKGRNFEAVMSLRTRKGSISGLAFIPENFDEVPVNMFHKRGEGGQKVSITRLIGR